MRLLLLVVLSLSIAGCQTADDPEMALPPPAAAQPGIPQAEPSAPESAAGAPTLAVLYHPYGPALEHAVALPHPVYRGWTARRIQADLRRLAATPIDLVLVRIHPQEQGPRLADGISRWRAMASAHAGAPEWMLSIDGSGTDAATLQAMVPWLERLALVGAPRYRTRGGRPLVQVVNSPPRQLRSDYLAFEFVQWREESAAGPVRSREGRDVRIRAALADSSEDGWAIPRAEGKHLRQAVAEAAALQPARIVIESWNNFRNGSFIQPNTLDEMAMLKALAAAVAEHFGDESAP